MTEASEQPRKFYTIKEAAAESRLPVKTWYQYVEERRLEYISLRLPGAKRGRILIPAESYQRFIDAGRVRAR